MKKVKVKVIKHRKRKLKVILSVGDKYK